MTPPQSLTVSLIVPTDTGGEALKRCLSAAASASPPADEIIVVVDGGDVAATNQVRSCGLTAVVTSRRRGPAAARNHGAARAQGDVLFFVDSDVVVPGDSVEKVRSSFLADPGLCAVFGSYDDAPEARGFLSQYKNLIHHYVHQQGSPDASTFWAGCGAVRRDVFLGLGGFDERYATPSIEDIELGYRLRSAGCRILLRKDLQAKHLKRWTAASLLRSDFVQRALPWSRLILGGGGWVRDLNVSYASRICVFSAWVMVLALALAWVRPVLLYVAAACGLVLLVVNRRLYHFFWRHRSGPFAIGAIPWHWLYFLYSGLAFALAALERLLRHGAPNTVRRSVSEGTSDTPST